MQFDGSGKCYLFSETDAIWVEGIYDFMKHIYEITAYPIFKDLDGYRSALDYPIAKKKFPFFSTEADDVQDVFDAFFKDGESQTIRDDILKTSLESCTVTVIHSARSFDIYLNNEDTHLLSGERGTSRFVTCKITSSRHTQQIRVRNSDRGGSVAYAVAE